MLPKYRFVTKFDISGNEALSVAKKRELRKNLPKKKGLKALRIIFPPAMLFCQHKYFVFQHFHNPAFYIKV